MIKYFLVIFFTVVIWFFGAVTHEVDLAKNFEKYGDAKAWFFEINKDKECHNYYINEVIRAHRQGTISTTQLGKIIHGKPPNKITEEKSK